MHLNLILGAIATAIGLGIAITSPAFADKGGVPGTMPYSGGPLPPGFSAPGVRQGYQGPSVPTRAGQDRPGYSNGQKRGWSFGTPGSPGR